MCLFIILWEAGETYKGDESIRGTQEREGERDSTAAAEISGSAGQPIELLSWSGGTLWRCACLCVCLLYPVKVVHTFVALFDRQFT